MPHSTDGEGVGRPRGRGKLTSRGKRGEDDTYEYDPEDWTIERFELLAYGRLGLLPDQFWPLTPRELQKMLLAHAREDERKREWPAISLAQVIQACGRWKNKAPSIKRLVDSLLGRETPDPTETRLQVLERKKARLAAEARERGE